MCLHCSRWRCIICLRISTAQMTCWSWARMDCGTWPQTRMWRTPYRRSCLAATPPIPWGQFSSTVLYTGPGYFTGLLDLFLDICVSVVDICLISTRGHHLAGVSSCKPGDCSRKCWQVGPIFADGIPRIPELHSRNIAGYVSAISTHTHLQKLL